MKNRLDKEMVLRGIVPSRTKAQELIKSSLVKCNDKVVSKPNYLVSSDEKITLLKNNKLKYVSRGGLKLEKAINEFNLNFNNLKVLDIGSSTGGFCDCSLKHGASHVTCIDVGINLLHESLRGNKKITLLEQTNFKELNHKYFENIDIIVCDVSFISLTHIIDKIYNERIKTDMVCLIKPQFECGKEIATKYRGIILNKDIHINIMYSLIDYFNKHNFYIKDLTSSPIRGGDGNIEYLAYISNMVSNNKEINISKFVRDTFKSYELKS